MALDANSLHDELKNHFDIEKRNIRFIVIYGSRVYRTASNQSDYDLLIVVDDLYTNQCLLNDDSKELLLTKVIFERDMTVSFNCGKEEVEAHIMDTTIYLKFILKNKPVMTQCLWIPDEFILYEDDQMKKFKQWFCHNDIQYGKVRTNFVREAEIWCYAKAKRLYSEGDIPKALKNLVHGIRYLKLTLQVLETGGIYDFTVANDTFYQLMSHNYSTIDEYLEQYRPIYDNLMEQISDLIDEKEVEGSEETNLLLYLNKYDISHLSKRYPVNSFLLKHKLDGLVKIQIDSESIKAEQLLNPLVGSCNGTIVKQDANGYQCISKGVCREINHELFIAKDMEDNFHFDRVYENTVGTACTLFYYQNEWHVSPDNSALEECLIYLSYEIRVSETEALFWNRFNQLRYKLPDGSQYYKKCFTFILASHSSELVLHCVRDMETFREEVIEDYSDLFGWKSAKRIFIHTLNTNLDVIEHLMNECLKRNILEQNGFYCRDLTQNDLRLVVLHPLYLYMNKCKFWDLNIADNNNPFQSVKSQHNMDCIVDAVRFCDKDRKKEIIAAVQFYYPLYSALFTEILSSYWNICDTVNTYFKEHNLNELDSQYLRKNLSDFPYEQTSFIFQMKKQKVSTVETIFQTVFLKPATNMLKQKSQKIKTAPIKYQFDTRVILQMIRQCLEMANQKQQHGN
jgi:predicted nucleotidyltransferase